ncbi:MAG TPA: TonB-dependent receptor, partial [Caulobacteraceae bacterium]|nr:TonB-dependent receptor [Caulobacteraceae bacterium]
MRGLISALLCATSSLAFAARADAQEAAPSTGATTLSEVVVTAQKREQALIDVPLSITAVGGAELARRNASTINDLQYAVPGLSITEFSPGQQRVQLRGVSVYSGLPTVGVYLDELPLNTEANQTGQDVRLLDISRIEVLRGPQGTLYGQGAVGGTIRYITNDPDLSRYSAAVNGETGAVSGGGTDWKVDGVVNAPLVTDRLGARLAASYQHFGGWIDNPLLGDKNVNSGHALTLRGKVAVRFSDDFKLTLMVQHQELRLGAQNLSDENHHVFDAGPTPFRSKATLLNATATYDTGFAELLSSTGYITRQDSQTADLTATFKPFLPLFDVPSAAVQNVLTVTAPINKIFTQEVRLASKGETRLGWTVGAFFRDSKATADTITTVTPDLLPPGVNLLAGSGTSPSNSQSWAVFGEGTYKLTPRLTALVGLRYFEDRRKQDSTQTTFGFTSVDVNSAKFTSLSPRFNLSCQPT